MDIGDEEYREISKIYVEVLEEHKESRQQVQGKLVQKTLTEQF